MVCGWFVYAVRIHERIGPLVSGGLPHCKRCGCELDRTETACPQCNFNPRSTVLRVATALLMGIVVLIILASASVFVAPTIGSYLLLGAFISFLLALLLFLVSLVITPYRFGRLVAFLTRK